MGILQRYQSSANFGLLPLVSRQVHLSVRWNARRTRWVRATCFEEGMGKAEEPIYSQQSRHLRSVPVDFP